MKVIPLKAHEKKREDGHDLWLRRQALQLAAVITNHLPEEQRDAIQVLDYAIILARNTLMGA